MQSIKELPTEIGREFLCIWYEPVMGLDSNTFKVMEDGIHYLSYETGEFELLTDIQDKPWKYEDLDYQMFIEGEENAVH